MCNVSVYSIIRITCGKLVMSFSLKYSVTVVVSLINRFVPFFSSLYKSMNKGTKTGWSKNYFMLLAICDWFILSIAKN